MDAIIKNIDNEFSSYLQKKHFTRRIFDALPAKREPDTYDAVNEYLNLSHRDLSPLYRFLRAAPEDKIEEFIAMIKRLTEKGIVGYEFLEIRGRPYKSYITTKFIKPYSQARFYRGSTPSHL